MKVALTITGLARKSGGPSRAVVQLAESLTRRGQRVTLVTKATSDIMEIPDAVDVLFYRYTPDECRECFRSSDVIHDNGLWELGNFRAARLAMKYRKSLVISPHGMLEPWALSYHRYRKRVAWFLYQKSLLQYASGILVTAESERSGVEKILPGKRSALAPNGIELGDYPFDPSAQRKKQVLFLSRLHPIKGVEMLIKSWAELLPPGWKLLIVGEGEASYVRSLKEQARGLPSVRFCGPVYGPQKAQLYAESRFFVLPTFSENFGIVVLEALASGCPVITTTGAPWEVLASRECGWWIDPSQSALTAALRAAIGSQNYARLSINARQLAEVGYSWDGIAATVEGFYQELLQRRGL